MDYSKYSTDELLDSLSNIDREAYPENYANLKAEISKRQPEIDAMEAKSQEDFSFTVERRIELLSWLQIATSIGFGLACINVFFDSMNVTDISVYLIIALFFLGVLHSCKELGLIENK